MEKDYIQKAERDKNANDREKEYKRRVTEGVVVMHV